MKKITFMLMYMLAMLTGFSACSSDNNDGDKQMTTMYRFLQKETISSTRMMMKK